MSKVVRVHDGDYRIITKQNGTIVLDTGGGGYPDAPNETGEVIITGNLTVLGSTTTVDSEDLSIRDNIIYLNKDETGSGVSLVNSGFTIERGTQANVSLFFNETTDTFRFIDDLGNLIPLQSNSIRTGGGDLQIFTDLFPGDGVISVSEIPDYEDRCTDPDDIPNVQFVYDYVLASSGVAIVDRFYAYAGTSLLDTGARAYDTAAGAGTSRIVFEVDGTEIAQFNNSGLGFNRLLISENTISSTDSNDDLELYTSGTGSVFVDAPLSLANQGSSPSADVGQTKIYASSTVGTGGTGINFINPSVNGELISSKKALLYALLF